MGKFKDALKKVKKDEISSWSKEDYNKFLLFLDFKESTIEILSKAPFFYFLIYFIRKK